MAAHEPGLPMQARCHQQIRGQTGTGHRSCAVAPGLSEATCPGALVAAVGYRISSCCLLRSPIITEACLGRLLRAYTASWLQLGSKGC